MPLNQGLVAAPGTTGIGTNPAQLFGHQADGIVSELHGKHYTACYNGRLFGASAVAVTIPFVTSGVVSVFTLYNPPGSGVNMEMVETTIGQNQATTVVDTIGWYYSPAVNTAAGTFTTAGTVQNLLIGGGVGAGKFYSAYTHNGSPTLIDIIGAFGAAADTVPPPAKFYDGRLILPPGLAMSVCASTTVFTASGLSVAASWAEWPIL